MGNLWALATFVGPILLGAVILWAILRLDRSTGKVASRRKDLNFAYINSSEFNGHKSIRNSSTVDGMVVRLAYIEES